MRIPLLLFVTFGVVKCYKFLVYSPLFGHSHCNYMGTIADTLTEAGHNVTVLMPVMDRDLLSKDGVKITEKKIVVEGDPEYSEYAHSYIKMMFQDYWTMGEDLSSLTDMTRNFTNLFSKSCDMLISNSSLLNQLREENFDVAISETFYICGFGLFEHLNIKKVIAATSMVRHDTVSWYLGEPLGLSYVPVSSETPSDMIERGINALGTLIGVKLFNDIYEGEAQVLRKHFGKTSPSPGELLGQASIHFTQSNPYLDYPAPKIHKTVNIGGLTANFKEIYPLDGKWNRILSQRKHNVLVSFGSVSKSKDMPENYKRAMIEVFASLPNITFIWKYEEDSNIVDHLNNVFLEKWTPQTALLADSRLSAFVTHGGLGSTTEVAHAGKPAIMIPIFGEQPYNAGMLYRHGGALVLSRNDLSDRDKLRNTILKIVHDRSFAERAKTLADVLRKQPISPKHLLVRHAEFVAKFGPLTQLQPHGRHLSVVEYYLVDVIAGLICSIVTSIFIFAHIVKKVCNCRKTKLE